MKAHVQKELAPCPSCGGHNIIWGGYYYVSLICNDCHFEMWPTNDFATEEEIYKEWDNLNRTKK